jgi:hypothetical protein
VGAVTRNFTVEQGTSFSAAWHIKIDGEDLDPAAGWQARSQVRLKKTSEDVLHEFDAVVVGSVVQLSVSPDVSSAWSWRRGVYDVELYSDVEPPRVMRVVQGVVTVNAEVTRP